MQNTMRFELSSRQIKIREILKKEFLELEIYAISDINPNRNQTHFTLESMQNALPDFKNKPIVASFANGDFGSHDGKVSYDKELEHEYWNVEGGEQILGWIRESDPVEIVEEDGLHWIKFTCALCVTYCYNQVKKLLKDKSKRVSVEVTIHQAEIVDGIEEIYDFTLNGVTILGTKNGKPVIEAIPGAHASILDKLDTEVFDEQRRVLSFAYKKIEGNDAQKSLKEESTSVENQIENVIPEQQTFAEVCPDCGEPLDQCKCAHDENCESGGQLQEEHDEQNAAPEQCEVEPCAEGEPEQCATDGEQCETCESGGQVQEEHDEHNECGENHSEECATPNEGCAEPEEGEPENCESGGQLQEEHDEHNDCGECEPGEEGHDDDDDDDEDELYKDLKCQIDDCNCKMAALEEKCAALESENCSLKEQLEKCADYEDIKARMVAAEAKLQAQFCADLKMKAIELMSSENIKDEDRKAIEEKCEAGTYACETDLEKDIAFAIYSARPQKAERYSASIVEPNTISVEQQQKDLSTMTREERIAERNKRGNKTK